MALLIAGLVWFSPWIKSRPVIDPATTSRAIVSSAELRTLADGSVVELKDGSEIAVDFGGALRRVALRNGEAHFQVGKEFSLNSEIFLRVKLRPRVSRI